MGFGRIVRALPPALQVIGLAGVAIGLGLIYPPAGVIAAGIGTWIIGWVFDQGSRS